MTRASLNRGYKSVQILHGTPIMFYSKLGIYFPFGGGWFGEGDWFGRASYAWYEIDFYPGISTVVKKGIV